MRMLIEHVACYVPTLMFSRSSGRDMKSKKRENDAIQGHQVYMGGKLIRSLLLVKSFVNTDYTNATTICMLIHSSKIILFLDKCFTSNSCAAAAMDFMFSTSTAFSVDLFNDGM